MFNYNQMIIPLDIFNILCTLVDDFKILIYLYSLNKTSKNCINITNLYDLPYKYLKKLTQEIIEQEKFKFVVKLNASYNNNICNVNHLKIH